MEKNIVDKNYCNYEAYLLLLEEVETDCSADEAFVREDAEMEMDIVIKAIDAFTSYVKTVDDGETFIRFAYATMEGNALRVAVENADRTRRNAHESAIAMASILNRMAAKRGVPMVFNGDINDRLQVADFCLEITVKVFQARKL